METIRSLLVLALLMSVLIFTVMLASGVLSLGEISDGSQSVRGRVAEVYRDITGEQQDFPLLPGVTVEIDDPS